MYMLVEALCSHVSSRESHLKLFTEAYLQHQHILCPKKKKKVKMHYVDEQLAATYLVLWQIVVLFFKFVNQLY